MANAVANALTSLGAMPNQLPLSPARVWSSRLRPGSRLGPEVSWRANNPAGERRLRGETASGQLQRHRTRRPQLVSSPTAAAAYDMVDGIYYVFIWFPSKSRVSCQP
jgi:hypothetical protein